MIKQNIIKKEHKETIRDVDGKEVEILNNARKKILAVKNKTNM